MVDLFTIVISRQELLGYWGYNSPSDSIRVTPGALVGLSASGLPDAFDIWAKPQAKCLTLGRETFGRLPLYWIQQERGIWFASQIQLLLPQVKSPQVSIPALYGYSCFSYVPNPLTPVAKVFSIPAGREQSWRVDEDGSIVTLPSRSLWEWKEDTTQLEDEAIAIPRLQKLLQLAVDKQTQDLDSSEPVGVLLSGGLDSSIVAALLVQRGLKVRAYTLDFGKSVISPETSYAEHLAQVLDIPLTKVPVTGKRVKSALPRAIACLDVPFGDGVTVPLYLLTQAASRDTRVIFNGEGGDQLFAGWTNKPLIAAKVYAPEDVESSFEYHYLKTFHRLWGYEERVFQPEIYAQVREIMPQEWLKSALDPQFNSSLLHRLRRATLMLKGAQNIHPRASNLALTQGLQVRSPFCDLDLVQETFSISGKLFLLIPQIIAIAKTLPDWSYLDFGGFGYPYRSGVAFDWQCFGQVLTDALKGGVELIIEPGRAAIARCGTLLTTVVSVKWQGERQIVEVDTTVGNLSVPSVHGGYRKIIALNDSNMCYSTDVCGNTTYSRDYLGKNCLLPSLSKGDILAILDVGAYGYAMSSHFLHSPRPAEVLVNNTGHRLIRQRETYEVLLTNQVF
ncbi:asparagine synthase-related protein [Gloeocapsa sp. PCC 73106]|uniref:asparagine synthase-related protein n=1 Tax=Gloeocapsa sp. PCC 73106 TaxID=102232 RepID=UPI0002ABC318|nr:asparagine synthase-related protein [Gloeocapsa sp. PCC 73106]ELR98102.1 diaminopimelate decarboxylase [Gloeocapsa sp. PCC 73106]